jgi:predicted DNA-binding protein
MMKRRVGRPELFPGEEIVYEAFKLPRSLKARFNKVTHRLRHNKSEIFRGTIEEYLREYEEIVEKESA